MIVSGDQRFHSAKLLWLAAIINCAFLKRKEIGINLVSIMQQVWGTFLYKFIYWYWYWYWYWANIIRIVVLYISPLPKKNLVCDLQHYPNLLLQFLVCLLKMMKKNKIDLCLLLYYIGSHVNLRSIG
jgi:hypothetical protein